MVSRGSSGAGIARVGCKRILLYSHDSFGLGHLRRSITIASGLAQSIEGASLLIATGSPCATRFQLPPGLDVVKLPSAGKDPGGAYVSRGLREDLSSIVEMRSRLLLELYRSFRPDLLIVDHKVLGLHGELAPVLEVARKRGTRTMLGIRDIIDHPVAVAREWGGDDVRRALSEQYDRISVYGSPEVFDPRVEYPIPPELGERVEFTGYVVRPGTALGFRPVPTRRPQVLVTVGGGEDGAERIETYLEAVELSAPDPPEWDSAIVLGPLLDPHRARRIKRRARSLAHVRVHSFYEDLPRLLDGASAVVAMAGYNTVAEILRNRVPAVLLPRYFPRREQLLRARRLEALGWAECQTTPSPESLRDAVANAVARRRIEGEIPPMNGVERVTSIARELLGIEREVTRKVAP